MPSSDSSSRDERLEQVLAGYLRAIDAGETPDEASLLAEHPDLAEELRSFFRNRAEVSRLARPFQAAAEDTPTVGLQGSQPAMNGSRVRYFGDYELLSEIARGGMGVVYRARQVSLNRSVAVKMILAGQFAATDDVRRFRQEAESAANLDHPNIVPIYEIGEHDGHHYFSMKLIEGGSLSQMLRERGGKLSERDAAKLIATVARAVHHAHQRGLLHRDLKPGNILLDSAGEPHVTDFGLAKRVEVDSDLTHSGAVVGTPSYMSPEQAQGEKTLTTGCDLFSLGAILYECLVGTPPFRGNSPIDTIQKVLHADPARPSSSDARIDRDLETIALKCLEKDPAQRYESAAALAEDLERWQRGEPITARPSTATEQLTKWVWRNPALAGLGAAIVVALLACVALGVNSIYQRELESSYRDAQLAKTKAEEATTRAEKSEAQVRQVLYASDISLAQHEWQGSQIARMRGLLGRHEPPPGAPDLRGFEWRYLNRLAHFESQVFPASVRRSYSLQVAIDGRTFVSLDRVGFKEGRAALRVWSPAGPALSRVVWQQSPVSGTQEFGSCFRIAAAPRGSLVAVEDHFEIRVIDAAAGREIRQLPTFHDKYLQDSAFSDDGKWLACGTGDGDYKLWEAATGREQATWKGVASRVLCFSKDGSRLYGGWSELCEYRVDDPKIAHKFPEPPAQIFSLAASPGGRWIAGGLSDGQVILWDSATRAVRWKKSGHRREVNGVVFARQGKVLASGSEDSTIRIWDVESGAESALYLGHEEPVASLNVLDDGETLVSAGSDGTVRSWPLGVDPESETIREQPWAIQSLEISPDSKTIIVVDYTEARLYDAATLEPEATIELGNWTFCSALSPDGTLLATGGNQGDKGAEPGLVKIWDLKERKLRATLDPHTKSIQGLEFSRDGKMLVGHGWADSSGSTVWRVADGKELRHFPEATFSRFNFDGSQLAMRHAQGVKIWHLPSDAVRDLVVSPDTGGFAFSPRSSLLAVTREGGPAELWNTVENRVVWSQPKIGMTFFDQITFSPQGDKVAIGNADNTFLCDTATGQILGVIVGGGNELRFSPDGRTLVTTYDDVELWNAQTGQHLLNLGPYGFEMFAVAFTPDSSLLAVAGGYRDENAGVKIWRAPAVK